MDRESEVRLRHAHKMRKLEKRFGKTWTKAEVEEAISFLKTYKEQERITSIQHLVKRKTK